ncbi:MAG: translation elongation factor Ts, partial [Muribaculaceae bacterium]|nr:translation elongation factor Ts [Muribaculaceae bacterium]
MAVTLAEITKLRGLTGAGMMDCKKALIESNGDMDAAVEVLRKKGQAIAAKREDREAAEGCVLAKNEGDFAAIVALCCETDFVAKNASFVALTQTILDAAIANRVKSLDELKEMSLDGRSVADHITDETAKTGEKIELGRYEYLEAPSTTSYNHLGNHLSTIAGFNLEGVDYQV